jgi:peptidoglycan/LPS O-acetylase OafA/YrhL
LDAVTITEQQRAVANVESKASSEIRHLQFLDAARGVAILLVVAVHALQDYQHSPRFQAIPKAFENLFYSGQYGVQLFFIASAITLAYSHDRRTAEPQAIQKFFARRFFRIAPLYWFGIALYSIYWIHAGTLTPSIVILNALFLHPYSRSAFISIPPGGWSIGVEMQFYVLLPVLVLVAKNLKGAIAALIAGLAVCLGSYATLVALNAPHGDQSFTYFWLPNQAPIFGMGLVCYQLLKDTMGSSGKGESRPSAALLASIALFVLASCLRPSSALYHLVLGAIFSVFVVSLGRSPWKAIVNRPLVALGKISYSVYILHFVVLAQVFKVFDRISLPLPAPCALCLVWLAGVAVTIPFATLTHRFIEEPGIALGRSVLRRAFPARG